MGMVVYPQSTPNSSFWLDVVRGAYPNITVVQKFGRNPSVGTSFTPVSFDSTYRTPQVSGATTLRIKAGNVNDTAAGSGARKVLLQGLDETGAEVTEELVTAGTSASSATTATFIRLYRAYIVESGTYATEVLGSQAANIVIENSAGTEDWLTIDSASISKAQSETAMYSIPLGKTGFVQRIHISVDSGKSADIILMKRENILQTAAPYSAMRSQLQWGAVKGEAQLPLIAPLGPFPELTDVGFMARGDAVSEVDIDYEIVLIDN